MAKKITIYGNKPLYEGYLAFLEKVLIPLLEVKDPEEINKKLDEICRNLGCEDGGE
ncbi:hypothetical protein [Sulfurisphaera ohwakuensis]|uniref:hypothetical protein n=1 Tax=Sulfurisphaera ohwakuensis TaxID=69656 RepID=UPI0036F2D75C